MKKTFSKLLSLLMFFCCLFVDHFFLMNIHLEATAICCCKDNFDKSKYTLTGNMAIDVAMIAKSQAGRKCSDFGYSGDDYGAWCDEFVADCIENAGGDDSIVAHGGDVYDFVFQMKQRGACEVSSPQTGDLVVFDGYSHVEIVTKVENGIVYCAGGNNGGGEGKCAGERKASYIKDTLLYLRPKYRAAVSPGNVILSIDKNDINAGECFSFSMSADTFVDYYWVTIIEAKSNEVIISESTNGSFSTSFLKCGHYYAWCTAANGAGAKDSNGVDFYVYGYAPTTATISSDKSSVVLGETVRFSLYSDTYYSKNYVSMFDPNGERCYSGFVDNQFSYQPTMKGKYSVYFSAYTTYGSVDSPWISFSVCDKNHKWDNGTITVPATCTTNGEKSFVCTTCKATKTETIIASGHDYGQWERLDDEKHQRVCENDASHKESENHTWGKEYIVTPATCADHGISYYFCTSCNTKKAVRTPIDKNNHAGHAEVRNAINATCFEAGYTGDTYCKDCNTLITLGDIIEKKPHDDSDGDGRCDWCSVLMNGENMEPNCVCGQYHTGPFAKFIIFFHRIIDLFRNQFKFA